MATNRRQFFSLVGGTTAALLLPGTAEAYWRRRRSVCDQPAVCPPPASCHPTSVDLVTDLLDADATVVGPEDARVEFVDWLGSHVRTRHRAPNGTNEFIYVAFSCRRLSGTFDELPRAIDQLFVARARELIRGGLSAPVGVQWDDSNQYISVYGYFNVTQDRYNCGRPTYGIRDSNGRCCYSRYYRRDNTYHESAGWVNYTWSTSSGEKLGVTYADADNTRGVFSFRGVSL